MSNPRVIIQYDETETYPNVVDANGAAHVHILDANGDPYFTQTNPAYIQADDLDIRALDPAIDEVVVQATDLDIRNLDATQDNVEVLGLSPDGTNQMPSLDDPARLGYVRHTDGTNNTPSMDAVARQGYVASQLIDESGTAYGVKHVGNKPRVSCMPYTYDIAEGNIADHIALNKFGHNETVGASWETIWTPSIVYPYMTTADQLEVLSDDVDDDDTDTGAWTVKIFGLDANWDEINETVTMNGTGVVTTTASFIRVFRAQVITAGTSGVNEGTITIRDQDTDTTRAQIDPGIGQTLMAVWTVPDGHDFYMTSWYAGSAVTKVIDIGIFVRDNAVSDASLQNKQFINFSDTTFKHDLELPIMFTSRTDIEIRAKASGGGGDLSAGFNGWYEL